MITQRQINILKTIADKNGISRADIEIEVSKLYKTSKPTILREISELARQRLIKVKGRGPSTEYFATNDTGSLPIFDLESYFSKEPDERAARYTKYNQQLLDELTNIFTSEELILFEKGKKQLSDAFERNSATEIKKEIERFSIELSWKSSQIEGNTYNLLDTENLLKNNVEAEGHTQEEKIMIVNHKKALEYIISNKEKFKTPTITNLKEIHAILVDNLNIEKDFRHHLVGITGTAYKPLDNIYEIQDAINHLVNKADSNKNIIEKAFLLLLFISYAQPFADGNKRTARLLSNAILYSNNYYPLSYRSVDEKEYKKALIIFYEQNNLYYFKEMFVTQYKFAMDNYFK